MKAVATVIAITLNLAATSASGDARTDFDCPAIKERVAELLRMNEAFEALAADIAEKVGAPSRSELLSQLAQGDGDRAEAARMLTPLINSMVPVDEHGAIRAAADYATIYAAFCK
tara:strand:+ start:165 stop:509 length:345 start_codon:yes stop_codon:yes gene_type:complete